MHFEKERNDNGGIIDVSKKIVHFLIFSNRDLTNLSMKREAKDIKVMLTTNRTLRI